MRSGRRSRPALDAISVPASPARVAAPVAVGVQLKRPAAVAVPVIEMVSELPVTLSVQLVMLIVTGTVPRVPALTVDETALVWPPRWPSSR